MTWLRRIWEWARRAWRDARRVGGVATPIEKATWAYTHSREYLEARA